jgi:hypothetical protein
MKKLFIVFACITALAVLLNVPSASAQGKLEGVWKVAEVKVSVPKPATITPLQPSLLICTKKHFSYVGLSSDKPRPDLPQKATDAQKVAAWEPLTATSGTYEVKGATVTFKAQVSKNPIEMQPGGFLTLDFKVEGNSLIVTPKATEAGPIPNAATVKLVRVE